MSGGKPSDEKPKQHAAPDSPMRAFLRTLWVTADRRHSDLLDQGDPISLTAWQEFQAREREERMHLLMKDAVYEGTMKAHLRLIAIGFVLWVFAECASALL